MDPQPFLEQLRRQIIERCHRHGGAALMLVLAFGLMIGHLKIRWIAIVGTGQEHSRAGITHDLRIEAIPQYLFVLIVRKIEETFRAFLDHLITSSQLFAGYSGDEVSYVRCKQWKWQYEKQHAAVFVMFTRKKLLYWSMQHPNIE